MAQILVVDDEEPVARLVARIVERAGHRCTVAENAAAARAELARRDYDLVFCDVQMPGESGIDLARAIADEHSETAVVMISGLDDPVVAESALEVGAYGYLVKPVARNEILINVANALRRRALEQQNRADHMRLQQALEGLQQALEDRSHALERERALRAHTEEQADQNATLLASLQERQALLERLSKIQRSISHRAELQVVLDSIVAGAHELLGDEIAALRLVDQDDVATMVIRAATGISDEELAAARRATVGDGVDGRAIAEGRLVNLADCDLPADGGEVIAGLQAATAIAAPVREDGAIIGSLVVASRTAGRTFTEAEQDMLLAFADHASLALTDASMLEQIHDAGHDPLTGLPNRNVFMERTSQTIAAAGDDDPDPAVLLIDLDRFGVVNETLGHEVGDALLVALATRLRECMEPSDTVARFGGDDFAVLLDGIVGRCDPEGAAARIYEALATPVILDGKELAVSASIGIASGRGDAQELLRHADIAMYRARRQGRGRSERFQPGMKVGLLQHLELEADLQRAVERNEFEVHYQPLIAMGHRNLVGFEALVRWQHPQRGLIPPLAFIPLAEEMGLINAIGQFVLREACAQAARWESEHPSDPPLSLHVNLSARQLQNPALADEVKAVLREFGVDAERLVLEVTETILMKDADRAEEALGALKKLGMRLAIDDFGTGYSSLNYIRRFPLDMLKIAKPFIDGIARSREDSALVRAIIDLAANFNLQVVAEGVETSRQAVELHRLGCELVQGYYFSRPVDSESAARLLTQADRGYGRLGPSSGQDFTLRSARSAGRAAALR